ncbi:glycosyltransferase family 4 protein [Thermomonospora amylolytica]|uniref:glycosyltransferase family 4 protein n=1 Tax=Thermomonospora amylolytica TaxID=1411117 RepID=UPI000E6BF8D3|nr:glycosyltransferase family 4 protein [Thermomonospora amylolytica]
MTGWRRKARGVSRRTAGRLQRLVRRSALLLLRLLLALRGRRERGERVRIRILLQTAYGMGGTIRTALNLAGHLAARYDVEIISVIRNAEQPFFAFPPGVTVVVADDRTGPQGPVARLLSRLPSVLTPRRDVTAKSVSLWTDLCLARTLLTGRQDVLIGTKPVHNMLIAEVAPRSVVKVGQDHMNLTAYKPWLQSGIARSYPRLDLLTVLTQASVEAFGELLDGDRPRIVQVPNAIPELNGGPADPDQKVIIAAGRLTRQKGYDMLVRAYAEVAPHHPDWELRIFGSGPKQEQLERLIDQHDLHKHVRLMGRSTDLGVELARASVCVLSSRFEGMPMVILEAMSKGLPTVAFDCPTGPAELITHEVDGLLVPAEDVPALAAALRRIIADDELRRRLGERARRSAEAYALPVVGARWEELIEEITGR